MEKHNDPLDYIEKLMQEHGFFSERTDKVLIYRRGTISITATIAWEQPSQNGVMQQLDCSINLAEYDAQILESFVGIGKNSEDAYMNALENFRRVLLHVILTGFLDAQPVSSVRENWQIHGTPYQVTIGDCVLRGGEGIRDFVTPFFKEVEKILHAHPSLPTLSWVSIFVSNRGGDILLNNKPWASGQNLLANFSWPRNQGGDFWSLRLFCILKKGE